MLRNTRYLGAEELGRVFEPKEEKKVVYPTAFHISEGAEQFDDPFQQAEYAYSLIKAEVQDSECE